MSGARRGPGRPRRNVADDGDEPEMYGDANANMWAEMMHQQQQFQAQQAQQHQEYHHEAVQERIPGSGQQRETADPGRDSEGIQDAWIYRGGCGQDH